ncbi:type I restriction endonuclease [Aeromonas caviae]|uniref:restriction endonuclease subunit S n=1 Tax=Aeromonas caviae TaxID=648 RepID=UPI001CC77C5F|nr:restriction endonuclease subunit S [Aeromonas caviae]GJB75356.1 type I restriction endonuclease [Aeromonas caviae]
MSHYKPYPAYKDSGVEWIGLVPEHWKVAQIKRISALNPKKSTLSEEKDSLCTFLPMEKLRTNAITLDETRPIHEVYDGYSYFCDDDILIAKVTPCFENGNIAVANGLVNGIGFGSTEINVLRVNGKGHNRFLYYRLQEEQFRTIAKSEMRGTGGLKRVPTELFESFTFGLPDTDEQVTIAAALDRETARIDALIQKKTRFIDLLKEKRQALITHAVTKGLDPNAKMKDSGVEWIGQVPEHWEVVPSTWLFVESKERAHEDDQHLSATQKYGVISLADYERLEGRQVTHAVKNLEQRKHVELDDFVISMRSFQGGIERVKALGCVRSSYVVIQAGDGADKNYFAYLFKSGSYIQGLQATSSFIRDGQDLNYGNFRQVRLPKPGSDEQMQIAKFLDQETARIDALTRTTEQSITLLKERRAAFITAAVTGQIDLRGKQ